MKQLNSLATLRPDVQLSFETMVLPATGLVEAIEADGELVASKLAQAREEVVGLKPLQQSQQVVHGTQAPKMLW